METYKNLFWCPVDLPLFEYKQQLIDDFSKEFVPETARAFEAHRLVVKVPDYGITDWLPDLTESQLQLKKYITEQLPFEHIVNIKIHHMHRQGSMHIDFGKPEDNPELFQHNNSVEPCGYRMVLSGTRQGDLGVQTVNGEVRPELPLDTDWYVLGHTNARHGNTRYEPNRYVVFCHAWIDQQKHKELIERSLEKYSKYAVWNK